MYKVEWTEEAQKDLEKLDKVIAKKIKKKVSDKLAQNPYQEGEPLKGNLRGRWKFRFSSYRIIYEIKQLKLLILVIEVGHRREVYQK